MSAYKVEKVNVIGGPTGEKVNLIGGEKVNLIERRIIPEDPLDGESKPKLTSLNDDWFKTKRSDFNMPIHHCATEVAQLGNYIPAREPDPRTAHLPPYGVGGHRRPPYSTMKDIAPIPEIAPTGAKAINWPTLILLNLLYILFTWVTAVTRKTHLARQEEIKNQEEEKKRQEDLHEKEKRVNKKEKKRQKDLKSQDKLKRHKKSKESRSNKQNNNDQ